MITTNVIVAFQKIEDAKNIKSVLGRNGFSVSAACTSGAHVISLADHLDGGVVVCGYKLSDMVCTELRECLPGHFKILMVASEGHWEEVRDQDIIFLSMPLKVHALVETLEMIIETWLIQRKNKKKEPRIRNEEEQKIILTAKRLLMEKNNMTEDEAHKYIQKCSMDSGNSMVETAHMVMGVYG